MAQARYVILLFTIAMFLAGYASAQGITGDVVVVPPDNNGTQCIAQGQACTTYATGSANIDLCCDGTYCSDNNCVPKANPGFFVRVWNAITGSNPPTSVPPECNETANICFGPEGKVLCDAPLKDCVAKYGQCRCGNPTGPPQANLCPDGTLVCKDAAGAEIDCAKDEQQACVEKYGKDACACVKKQPSGTPTSTEPAQPASTGPQPNICDPCNTVICSYPQGGQFVCPASLKECVGKFGESCAVLGCFKGLCTEKVQLCKDPDKQQQVKCEGTLADCNSKYGNSCTCGLPDSTSSCPQTVHLCYTQSSNAPTTNAASNSAWQPVKCEGKYEDCLKKYGKCECGIPQPVTCQESVQLCYPLVYSGSSDVTTTTGIADSSGQGGAAAPPGVGTATSAAVPTTAPVRCEDTYENCVAKYGRCKCGAPNIYCIQDGARYKPGEQFKASDGCNICACKENGLIVCSERACPQPTDCNEGVQTCYSLSPSSVAAPQPIKCQDTLANCQQKYDKCICGWTDTTTGTGYCTYDGQTYKAGESFPAGDGCNSCSCAENGQVRCTLRACPPPPSDCQQTVNKCYPVTSAVTAALPPVKCSDTYANCVTKYGKCDCGYEEPSTTPPSSDCTSLRNVCKDASGALSYCSGAYADCSAKYSASGGSCQCGGTISYAKDPLLVNPNVKLTTGIIAK